MFVRTKNNRSGSIYVQIVDKANGYRVLTTIVCSRQTDQVRLLVTQGRAWIERHNATPSLFPDSHRDNGLLLNR